MRRAVWIVGALLTAGCVGRGETLGTTGWRGGKSADAAGGWSGATGDAGAVKDAAPAGDAGAVKDATVAKDAAAGDVRASDGRPPATSNDGGSGGTVDAGRSPDGAGRVLGVCTRGADCLTGFCSGGVCCNTACTGPCVSCAISGRLGTCWPVPAGAVDPRGLCVDEGAASCGTNGTCDGTGACAGYPAGTLCAPGACSGTLWTSPRTCDGAGTCVAALTVPCSPFRCAVGGDTCTTYCATSDDCAPGVACAAGVCGTKPQETCSIDAECASGHCAQNVCCASACAGPCSSCALPGTVGTCEPDPGADPATCG
ncbi:MAG TPA: hypothetical protein VHO06_22445 [Polyangia bacterium]|nr:hypothetical protein [Polyangia bacterium]